MDKQLNSPLLIETIGRPTKLSAAQTFAHLQNVLINLGPSPSRTQLERLADALGVETGAIAPSEGERREAQRAAERAAARAERRAAKEAARAAEEAAAAADLEGAVEGDDEEGDEGMGVGDFDDVPHMDDRGDVEYGDVPDDDGDEPDNEAENDGEGEAMSD